MKEEIFCPICRHKLVADGDFIYEDCIQQEWSSPKYMCPNVDCKCHEYECVWNDMGDYFSGKNYKEIREADLFPDNKYEAYGSFAMKQAVETYHKGLKEHIYLSPIFCLFLLKPLIEFQYTGNEFGEVLGRTWKIKFLSYDKNSRAYCTYYHSGLSSLRFWLKTFNRLKADYNENNGSYSKKELKNLFEKKHKWDRRFSTIVYKFYINTFYKKLKAEVNN